MFPVGIFTVNGERTAALKLRTLKLRTSILSLYPSVWSWLRSKYSELYHTFLDIEFAYGQMIIYIYITPNTEARGPVIFVRRGRCFCITNNNNNNNNKNIIIIIILYYANEDIDTVTQDMIETKVTWTNCTCCSKTIIINWCYIDTSSAEPITSFEH